MPPFERRYVKLNPLGILRGMAISLLLLIAACSGDVGSYSGEAIELGVLHEANTVCDNPYDPDCAAQPNYHCGYTTGSCPTATHSVYRYCWANCGDYAYGATDPCAADYGANAILCEKNEGERFNTCDLSCPSGYLQESVSVPDTSCGYNRNRVSCKKRPPSDGGGGSSGSGGSSGGSTKPVSPFPASSLPGTSPLYSAAHAMCVHPSGGSATPSPGTPAVMWHWCSDPRLQFVLPTSGSRGPIRHSTSGLCLVPDGTAELPTAGTGLNFSTDCSSPRAMFDGMDHVNSMLRLNAPDGALGARVVLSVPTSDLKATQLVSFQHTFRGDLLVHQTSLKCLRPQSDSPGVGDRLIFSDKCSTANPNHRFTFSTATNRWHHAGTGMCVHPEGGSAQPTDPTAVVLWPDCSAYRGELRFSESSSGIQHATSKKCVHPLMGSPAPTEGTLAVLHTGCSEDRLRFYEQSIDSTQLR